MTDFITCGLRVRSDIALPELSLWNGPERAADIDICYRDDFLPSSDLVEISPFVSRDDSGAIYITLASVGVFRIAAGREIAISPSRQAHESEVRSLVLGPALSVLSYQRGFCSFNATAIVCRGKAVVFCGHSGVGKSTVCAFLVKRGYELVSDGVTVVAPGEDSTPSAQPTHPYMNLWRDTLQALEIPVVGLVANRIGQEKYRYPALYPALPASIPIGTFVILKNRRSSQPAPPELVDCDLVAGQLFNVLDMPKVARELGLEDRNRRLTEHMGKKVAAFRSTACFSLAGVSSYVDTLEELINR